MGVVKILFEFFRVLILLFLLIAIFYYPLGKLYTSIGIDTDNYLYILLFAILILIYVIYSNRLQFTGFYRKKAKKLPSKITWSLVSIACLLLLVPIIIYYLK